MQLDCACLLRRSRIKGWCETNLTILSVGQATKNIMNHRSANAVGVSHRGKEKKIGEKNTSVWTEMGSRQEKMNVHLCLRLCRNISSHKVFVVPHDPLSDFAQQSCGKLVNIYIEDPRTHISESNLQL